MSDLVHFDALTGIGSRRFFDEFMAAEVRVASRTGTHLSLVMLDIDRFKQFNDLYGHPGGDRCLQGVADVLKAVCRRPRDLVALYGGEELAVILPDTDAAGVCAVRPDSEVLVATLIENADQVLYAAKKDGRNCVFCFDTGRNAAQAA